jgi:hypothetical protein
MIVVLAFNNVGCHCAEQTTAFQLLTGKGARVAITRSTPAAPSAARKQNRQYRTLGSTLRENADDDEPEFDCNSGRRRL